MKIFIFIMSLIISSKSISNPYACKDLITENKIPEFLECIKKICESAQTEQQIQACGQQNLIVDDPEDVQSLYKLVTEKFNVYQNEPKICNSHSDCINDGSRRGCYESSVDEVLVEGKIEYIRTLSLFLNIKIENKSDGQACNQNSDCESFYCGFAATEAATKVCMNKKFCRKAQYAEVAPEPILCDDEMMKDEAKKCRTDNFMQDRSRQLVQMVINRNNANICDPKDLAVKEFYDRLKTQNFSERAFEYLFADSTTKDAYHMQQQLRDIAKEVREKREVIIKKLNLANKKFKEEFLVITKLKSNSQEKIVFRGKEYTEADLFSQSIENGISLDLMTDLEVIRANYNAELANLYENTSKKFPQLIEDFIQIKEKKKNMKLGTKEWGNGLLGLGFLYNKKQWRYEVKAKDHPKKYLLEYNEGKPLSILSQMYPQYVAKQLIVNDAEFKDIPLFLETKAIREIIRPLFYVATTKTDRLNWFPYREYHKSATIFADMEKSYQENFDSTFSANTYESWDDLIDPEVRIYSGCYKKNGIPEDKKEAYCKENEKSLKDLKSHMLAQVILYGGTGTKKHYENNYFSGEIGDKDQSNSDWIPYVTEGPKGSYLRNIYETFVLLRDAYKSLSDIKDTRIACINKSRQGEGNASLFYNTYSSYDPNGYIYSGAQGNINGSALLGDRFGRNDDELGSRSITRTARDFDGNNSTNTNDGSSNTLQIHNSGVGSPGTNDSQSTQNTIGKREGASISGSSNEITTSSYTKKSSTINNQLNNQNNSYNGWEDSDSSNSGLGYQAVNRSGSSLSTEEAKHVMQNLNNYEVPVAAQDTIFEKISESYVDKAYPAIFSE